MAQTKLKPEFYESDPACYEIPAPDVSHLITEDDTPVDNIFSEKQQRLLTESLSISWKPGRPFLALANVGLYYGINEAPLVPDVMLSLDVQAAENLWKKKNRSYLAWEFGKMPEVVVEIISNREGGETDRKLLKYAQIGVWYYIVFDPQKLFLKDSLRVYELSPGDYIPKLDRYLPKAGIGVTLWEGSFDGIQGLWLRWCDENGDMIPTGSEKVEQEKQRAEIAEQKAEKLAEKLRELGINPEDM